MKPIELFMAKQTVTTRVYETFVFIKHFRGQGPVWMTIFRMSAPVDASDDEISWKSAISKPLTALKNAKSFCLRNMTRREGRLRVILRRHGVDWRPRAPEHRCALGTLKSIIARDLPDHFFVLTGSVCTSF